MASSLTVIFDCDGVLVDSERLSHTVIQEMPSEFGRKLSLQETLDHFMGTSTEKCLSVRASLIGRPVPPSLLSAFRDRTFDASRTSLEPIPRVNEILDPLNCHSAWLPTGREKDAIHSWSYWTSSTLSRANLQRRRRGAAGVDHLFQEMAQFPHLHRRVRGDA
jgi:beta-phosphoglucomutase-like phosphatase (HAD superfamily)